MSSLLLAPYNDSMRLGQGYNSFLQLPCLGNAVSITDKFIAGGKVSGQSQSVSYASSFVEKMSEVVRTMNISAGSSIMTGSVAASGGGSSIDEIKFAESDLNAVLSVKVTNQTRKLRDDVEFNAVDIPNMDSQKFHQVYGDCFISGFIEGGDLHGIVSIKALDASRKNEIKSALKGQFNGSTSDWSPGSTKNLNDALQQTEVTVTVNWSGGGLVKPSGEEWTIESLVRAASSFPEKVAKCPQKTWAILTRYDTIPNFVEYANRPGQAISVRRYETAQRYTSELLDMFMEYKSNIVIVNDAIRHPEKYQISSRNDYVDLSIDALVTERQKLKQEMSKIVKQIEILNDDPAQVSFQQDKHSIMDPELWRAKLPMRRDVTQSSRAQKVLQSLVNGLPLMMEPLSKVDQVAAENDPIATAAKLAEMTAARDAAQKNLDATQATIESLKTKTEDLETAVREAERRGEAEKKRAAELEAKVPKPVKPILYPRGDKLPKQAQDWVEANTNYSNQYQLSSCWVGNVDAGQDLPFKVSLSEGLSDRDILQGITIYCTKTYIRGVAITYTVGKVIRHGECGPAGQDDKILELKLATGEKITSCFLTAGKWAFGAAVVDCIRFGTSYCNFLQADYHPSWATDTMAKLDIAPDGYALKGLWTKNGAALDQLGVIWGKSPL